MSLFFTEKFLTDPGRQDEVRHWKELITSGNKKAGIQFGMGIFSRASVFEELSTITTPTLVMVGEKDMARPLSEAQRTVEKIPGAKLVIIPEAVHLCTIEEPGAVTAAIEEFLKNRLRTGYPVAFCLIDLDNFKSFNDRYGYAMGNEIIQATAKIIETAIEKHGTGDDFVGHIGGDDFALITTPEKYDVVCNYIIKEFDKTIVNFYDPEDRANGYIIGKTRQNQELKFPIMTISIAVVTNPDGKRQTNHIKIGEIAAELKGLAKSLTGSVFVVNRREQK